jgi:hypothetical protein
VLTCCVLLIGGTARAEIIDRILAVVSGGLILQTDVVAATRLGLATPPEGSTDPIQGVLDRLIERQLMLIEVDRYGPAEPPRGAIDAALLEIDKRVGSGERMSAILRETGMTVDQLRLRVRDDLRVRAYLDQRFNVPVAPAEDEVLEYYRTHPAEFTRDDALRPYAEVREAARQALIAERRSQLIREWLAGLRRRTEVNVLYLPGR